ncbi:MAG: hypothetical protein VZQ47_11375 [Treponema sp.]|nr:hypothetical protein [Treponema sp.]MEE3436143.1 hypothetical protein [Treponema sp.]
MKAILTKPEKERLLEQFEKSGKTHAQFAEENGLNVKTLPKWIYEWHRQIKTTNEVKFVEIKTTAISSANDIRIKKSAIIYIQKRSGSCQLLAGHSRIKTFLPRPAEFTEKTSQSLIVRYITMYIESSSRKLDLFLVTFLKEKFRDSIALVV